MFCLWNFMLQGPIALSGCSPHASKPCNCPAPRPKKVRGDSQQRESYKSSSKSWSDTPLWTEDSSIHQGQGAVWKGYQLQGELGCREPAWGIQPMAKVMRKEAWHTQRWDQASGVPLDILEYLPLKPESAYLTAVCFHLHFWHYGGLSPTTSLWKGANLELQLIHLLGVSVSVQKLLWWLSSLPDRFIQPHVIVHSLPTVRGMRCHKLSKYRSFWEVR